MKSNPQFSDIVNRLRTNRECLAPCLMDEAADEIVRLEGVVLGLIAERDEARRELERLYDEKFRGNGALDLLADLDKECGL
jgi:hypothetical protein